MAHDTTSNQIHSPGNPDEDAEERSLDQAIADSFPASDPVSVSMPHKRHSAQDRAPVFEAFAIPLLAAAGLVVLIAAAMLPRTKR
jgi:hypothetical protein